MSEIEVAGKFIEVFLGALLPVVVVFVVRWIKLQGDKLLAQIEAEKPELLYELRAVAAMAVNAAEQANVAGLIVQKKEYALSIAEKYLTDRGWHVDLDVISAAIEAAVRKEINHPSPGE